MVIVMLDREEFSFQDLDARPLAGAQTAFIELVKAFLRLGHHVFVRNYSEVEYVDGNLDWRHIERSEIPPADLVIVNRSTTLFKYVEGHKKKVKLWLHNEAKYLVYLHNLKLLFKYRPVLIFSGSYHRSTFPIGFLFKNRIIPYGISGAFKVSDLLKELPRPRVIFTSNPLRSLDWLVDKWKVIHRSVPSAELHVYSGPSTYGKWGEKVSDKMNRVLGYAQAHKDIGVVIHEPIPKRKLIEVMKQYRGMLYRGDKAETFCLAVAEAQSLGLPCVVQDIGSMKERVKDGITGFVTENDSEFIEKSIQLLQDNPTWQRMHKNCIAMNLNNSWSDSAKMFIE